VPLNLIVVFPFPRSIKSLTEAGGWGLRRVSVFGTPSSTSLESLEYIDESGYALVSPVFFVIYMLVIPRLLVGDLALHRFDRPTSNMLWSSLSAEVSLLLLLPFITTDKLSVAYQMCTWH